jgi:ATP-dependent DNA helicase RecG
MTRDALDYIKRNLITETVIKHHGRAEATRVENFPYDAIEEAVVNAVYHRGYDTREPIEVRIEYSELMVISYPGPDRSVRLEQLRAGRAQPRRYRNRRIGEFLKELEFTEGRSTGIPKIMEAMAKNGSPPAEFEFDEDHSYFMVRLPIHPAALEVAESATGTAAIPSVKMGAGDTAADAGIKSGLSRDQVEILRKCLADSPIADLMAVADRTNRTKFRDQVIKPMLADGLLEMTIPDKPTSSKQRYRITEKGRNMLASLREGAA